LSWFGIESSYTPFNISFFIALLCAGGVWVYIWRTSGGYELRVAGKSERVANYAGIHFKKVTIITLLISGALAGMMAVNEIMGVHHKLLLDFTAGFGFAGIAVALMGRNHPLGVLLASLLFGFLYQGGAELAFERPAINKEIILVIQGLIVLFSGALSYMLKPYIEKIYLFFRQ
jgi:simple sugar transport system permease protein